MSTSRPESPAKVVPGKRFEARALAAQVFERHGIMLREDDPAFAMVTLNELTLRAVVAELLQEVDQHFSARLAEFHLTMRRVEARAAKALAHQVRTSAGELQGTFREEIVATRVDIQRLLEQIEKTHRFVRLARWCAVSAVLAVVLLVCGFWVARL